MDVMGDLDYGSELGGLDEEDQAAMSDPKFEKAKSALN